MFSRIRRLITPVATLAVVAALSGCAESNQPVATGKGEIRGINAIVGAPEIVFFIEEKSLGGMHYKATSGFHTYDNLTYNFNFGMFLAGDVDATRVFTHSLYVVADSQYTIVLTGTLTNPSNLLWEDTAREWSDSETAFEIFFAHLAPSLGDVDIYFAPAGTPPVDGADVGSLSNGGRLEVMEFEGGSYELIVTAEGDAATILFQSVPLAGEAHTRVTLAIFDSDPSVTTDVAVSLITESGQSSLVPDANFPGQLRLLHAAYGVENVDGFLDSDFSSPDYTDIGFKEVSTYIEVTDSETTVTITPVGNSGATIHEGGIIVAPNLKRTVILGGTLAEPLFYVVADDVRPLEPFPIVRLINMSINTDVVTVYLFEAGTPIDEVLLPTFTAMLSLFDTGFIGTSAGMQELTITAFGDPTPIATPVVLDLANGDVVDIVIVDTVDPEMLEIVVFDGQ